MSDLEIIRILSEYSDQFQTFDLITYLLRSLGWLLVKLLYFLLEAVEGLLDTAYTMFGLLSYPPIQQFINTFKPAIYLLFIGSIMMLGYLIMFGNKEVQKKIAPNLVVAVIAITGGSLIISNFADITMAVVDGIKSTYTESEENYSVDDTLLAENVTDLLYFVDSNFTGTNDIDLEVLPKINVTETIDPFENDFNLSNDEKALFGNKLVINQNGEYELRKIEKGGILNWMPEYYFRYTVDFFPLFITLIASIAAIFFSAFKVAQLIYTLAIQQVSLIFVVAGDLHNGRRIKTLISAILNDFFTIMVVAAMMKMFLMASAFVNVTVPGLPGAFLIFALAMVTIDGPNIFERIFGVDAGLSSVFRTMVGAYHGSRLAMEVGKTAGSAVGAAGRGIAGLGGFIAGATTSRTAANQSNSIYSNQQSGSKNTAQESQEGSLSNSLYGNTQQDISSSQQNANSQMQNDFSVISGSDTGGDSLYSGADNLGGEAVAGGSSDSDGSPGYQTGAEVPDVIGGSSTDAGSVSDDSSLYSSRDREDLSPNLGDEPTTIAGNDTALGAVWDQQSPIDAQDTSLSEISSIQGKGADSDTIYKQGEQIREEKPLSPAEQSKQAEHALRPVQPKTPKTEQNGKKTVVSSARRGYAAGKKFRDGVLRHKEREDQK